MKYIFILSLCALAFPTQTNAQSKKEILAEANSKVLRNVTVLDSLQDLISKYNSENTALKNNNDYTIQSIDSLKKSKIYLVNKLTVEIEKEENLKKDFNTEIKRIESTPRYLDEIKSIFKFIYVSKSCEEENGNNSKNFIKSIKYL